ncbi:MAG: PhzF family phenazine biosynthesis protein [Gemmataceae bacterium]
MSQPIYVADAFTSKPFRGNPAAVCPLTEPRPEAWMRSVAAEMNLSETAFLLPESDGFRLRWLTLMVEVALCGHATLASAHILWETKRAQLDKPIRFYTRSGELSASLLNEGIELDFPRRDVKRIDPPADLVEALGVRPLFIGTAGGDVLCELESEAVVRAVTPDFAKLARIDARGIIITARGTDCGMDFVSRFFAPASGINEDPVTGSAHCALAPFWAERLGGHEFTAFQASARGGVLGVRLVDDRVKLVGRAVTVWRGELVV